MAGGWRRDFDEFLAIVNPFHVAQTMDSQTILGAAYAAFACASLDYTAWTRSAKSPYISPNPVRRRSVPFILIQFRRVKGT